MTRKGLGMTAVTDATGRLLGLFTDGDLRRVFDAGHDLHQVTIDQVMTAGGVTAHAGMLAAEALTLMQHKKINGLFITDAQGRPVGALNTQDLMRAGVL